MSDSSRAERPRILSTIWRWWQEQASQEGAGKATAQALTTLWHFVRDSTPERLRQRYGDAEYDWDHRVNTTSAAVSWRDRMLGLFHSPYQPTDPELFREMLDALQQSSAIDFRNFTFIDLGSGKGRTLLMASDYPFRKIIGLELLPSLHAVAEENLGKYHADSQKCFDLQSICADATQVPLPNEPTVLYLFNPFPENGLRRLLAKVEESLQTSPRPFFIIYHNPMFEALVTANSQLRKIAGTHQYSIFALTALTAREPA